MVDPATVIAIAKLVTRVISTVDEVILNLKDNPRFLGDLRVKLSQIGIDLVTLRDHAPSRIIPPTDFQHLTSNQETLKENIRIMKYLLDKHAQRIQRFGDLGSLIFLHGTKAELKKRAKSLRDDLNHLQWLYDK